MAYNILLVPGDSIVIWYLETSQSNHHNKSILNRLDYVLLMVSKTWMSFFSRAYLLFLKWWCKTTFIILVLYYTSKMSGNIILSVVILCTLLSRDNFICPCSISQLVTSFQLASEGKQINCNLLPCNHCFQFVKISIQSIIHYWQYFWAFVNKQLKAK